MGKLHRWAWRLLSPNPFRNPFRNHFRTPSKSGRNDRRSRAASGPKSIWLNGSKWADGKRKMGLAARRRFQPGSLPRYGWQWMSRDIDHLDIRWAVIVGGFSGGGRGGVAQWRGGKWSDLCQELTAWQLKWSIIYHLKKKTVVKK